MSLSILVLGGTRFVGRALARSLHAQGHRITVSSRRPQSAPAGVGVEAGERQQAISRMVSRSFQPDLVLDFTAYDAAAVRQAMQGFPQADYLLVSSTWVTRLWPRARADEMAPASTPRPADMPEATWNYVRNKALAEAVVAEHAMLESRRRAARIVRLPIMWGSDDHTGRLAFYVGRLAQGRLLLVDGGLNRAQIVWSQDVVKLIGAVIHNLESLPLLSEALPDEGLTVRGWIGLIAAACEFEARCFSIPSAGLRLRCPQYLEHEPLWREQELVVTAANLFVLAGLASTEPGDWLPGLAMSMPYTTGIAPVPGELSLLDRLEGSHG